MRKPSSDPTVRDKGPNIFLMLMIITGYMLIAYSVLNIIVNPIMGLGWDIAPEDSDSAIPKDWEGALGFLAIGIGWTLFWRFWAWRPVRDWVGKRKGRGWAIGLSLLSLLAIVIVIVERNSRREMYAYRAEQDSLFVRDYILPRKGALVVMNPTLERMELILADTVAVKVKPLEANTIYLPPGIHEATAVVAGKTLESASIQVPPGDPAHPDWFGLFNVGGKMNFALLDYTSAMDEDDYVAGKKCKDCFLVGTSFGEKTGSLATADIKLTLPRRSTLSIMRGDRRMFKMVFVPARWKGQSEKIRDYAVWKLALDESRGIMQDFAATVTLSDEEMRKHLAGRLERNVAAFEAAAK